MTRVAALLVAAAALTAPRAGAARPQAVVAVDALEVVRVQLPQAVADRLSRVLHDRAAALPGLRVIPPPEVQAQLRRMRRRALAEAEHAGRPEPLQLGRELAANKVLGAQVLGAGDRCVVTLSLIDVKTAAVEAAATSDPSSCDEAGLVSSLAAAVDRLATRSQASGAAAPAGPASPGTETSPDALPEKPTSVSVFIGSRPSGSPVSIDGKAMGKTPLRLDLTRGQRYRLTVGGTVFFETVERSFVAQDWKRIHVVIRLERIDPTELATTPEWVSLGVGGGFLRAAERPVFAVGLRAATFKWRWFFLTAADLLFTVASSGSGPDHRSWSLLSVGSRAGLPVYLGTSGKHQLLAGLGLYYSAYDEPALSEPASLLSLVPAVEYAYLASNGAAALGAGVSFVAPVAGELDAIRRPFQVLLTARVGLSLTPMLRSERRRSQRGGVAPAAPR